MIDDPDTSPATGPASSDALSEQQYRRLVEAVTDYAIYMLDADGRVATWNPGAQRIKGYSPAEVIGRHFSLFFTPEDVASGKPLRALQTARDTGRFEDEGWRCRKDGTRFWALAILDAIYDDDGSVIGFAKVTRDMTEWREAQKELEKAREDLFQAQKLEALGQLTGGVAHDFNNLLAAILSGLSLIGRRSRGDQAIERVSRTMREVVERGQSLTNHLLSFSRRQQLTPQPVLVQEQLAGTLRLLERLLGRNISVITDLPSHISKIMVDPNQFELAVLNICLNARDAMPDGGTLTISAHDEPADAAGEDADRSRVAVRITDTGAGIAPEVLPRVFEPYFTTKEVGKGSGLGLSQAYGFAERSGGSIEVDSKVGVGTTVTMYLPVATSQQKETVRAAPSPEGESDADRGVVLLVEDDTVLAEVTMSLLEDHGFSVKLAHSAAGALDLLRDDGPFDVVFSDIVMPGGLSGIELARKIRNDYPSTPVVLTTGYSGNVDNGDIEGLPLLGKPYETDRLLRTLDDAIAQSGARA